MPPAEWLFAQPSVPPAMRLSWTTSQRLRFSLLLRRDPCCGGGRQVRRLRCWSARSSPPSRLLWSVLRFWSGLCRRHMRRLRGWSARSNPPSRRLPSSLRIWPGLCAGSKRHLRDWSARSGPPHCRLLGRAPRASRAALAFRIFLRRGPWRGGGRDSRHLHISPSRPVARRRPARQAPFHFSVAARGAAEAATTSNSIVHRRGRRYG